MTGSGSTWFTIVFQYLAYVLTLGPDFLVLEYCKLSWAHPTETDTSYVRL
jgi:hypothetical protein